MKMNVDDFEIIIFPGKNPPARYLQQYNQAYRCWKDCWSRAFEDEMVNEEVFLSSDNFTRQDEILALYYKNNCVGVVFFRNVDFNEEASAHDTYFECWPPLTLAKLCRGGKKILVMSQFSLSPAYRKLLDGINPRDLIVGLCYERFQRSNCDAGASVVRLEKNMQKVTEKVGATTLFKNLPYKYDQTVDLIGYFPDKVHPSNARGVADLAYRIFLRAKILVDIKPLELSEVKVIHNLKNRVDEMVKLAADYPWEDPHAYGMYLAQTYYYVKHSTRMLAFAAGLMGVSDTPFHRRFLEHASEEKGHEILLLNDLKKLGFDISEFPELPETRMFWETQFYKIQHSDPLSVMGYIIALEAVASEQCPRLKKILETVHPEGSYSFIQVHGEEDPDHVEKACQVILSLSPERRKIISENFEQSVTAFQYLILKLQSCAKGVRLLKVG